MDCSPASFSACGILQARILEWVVMPSSRGSSPSRGWTLVSPITGEFFTVWATRKVPSQLWRTIFSVWLRWFYDWAGARKKLRFTGAIYWASLVAQTVKNPLLRLSKFLDTFHASIEKKTLWLESVNEKSHVNMPPSHCWCAMFIWKATDSLCAIASTQLYALINTPCGNWQFIFPFSFYGAQTQIPDSLGKFLSWLLVWC